MATVDTPRSMNEANDRDPYNNNCYGTLVDRPYVEVKLPILDVIDFNERVIRGYEEGRGEKELPADLARRPVAGPGRHGGAARLQLRRPGDSGVHPRELHRLHGLRDRVPGHGHSRQGDRRAGPRGEAGGDRQRRATGQCSRPNGRSRGSTTTARRKRASTAAGSRSSSTPVKCKGCAECVTVCDDNALKMIPKSEPVMDRIRKSHRLFKEVGPTDDRYINDNLLIDMMLKEQTHIYVGGAGSCAGCGEGTALRMMCAATGAKYGDQWGIVAATGCNTVYTSTYPYNPYLVPWTNSLFENAPADAMGVRSRWDQMGWQDKPLWCIGGDGAFFDIGFQSLSRLLASGMPVKCFVLDTQVYSNTGGQASTSSYTGQNTKMSIHGKTIAGKQERRKEIAQIAMMHPRTLRRPDHVRPHEPLLQGGARGAGVRRAGDRQSATRPASRSTAWPTTWRASRPGWPSTRGPSRC